MLVKQFVRTYRNNATTPHDFHRPRYLLEIPVKRRIRASEAGQDGRTVRLEQSARNGDTGHASRRDASIREKSEKSAGSRVRRPRFRTCSRRPVDKTAVRNQINFHIHYEFRTVMYISVAPRKRETRFGDSERERLGLVQRNQGSGRRRGETRVRRAAGTRRRTTPRAVRPQRRGP